MADQLNSAPKRAPEARALSMEFADLNTSAVLSDEFYNVDDFFNTYIAELTQRNKDNKRSFDVANMTAPPTQQPPANAIRNPNANLGVPANFLASIPQNINANNNALPPMTASPLDLQTQTHPHPLQSALQTSTSHDDLNAPAIGNSRFKTVKQQEANKIAQQRYRERKKQKYHEMERTVNELQTQLRTIQTLQQRNQILEGMNSELQNQLVHREKEIDRLKVVLDTQADASLDLSAESGDYYDSQATPFLTTTTNNNNNMRANTSNNNISIDNGCCGNDATACGPDPPNQTNMAFSCDILPRNLNNINFQTGFEDQINALKTYMSEQNLDAADPLGNEITREQMMKLGELVGRSCQLCQAAIRADGAKVLDLVVQEPRDISESGRDNDVWITALKAMSMSAEQQEQLLLLRSSHLNKVSEIYAERQSLNLEAMALMLPQHAKKEEATVKGRMESIASKGYLETAKLNAQLADVLDKIKDNLRREQRSIMDLNCCTVQKILSPLQAAKYMVTVYPQHCDALALSNVLAHQMGRV